MSGLRIARTDRTALRAPPPMQWPGRASEAVLEGQKTCLGHVFRRRRPRQWRMCPIFLVILDLALKREPVLADETHSLISVDRDGMEWTVFGMAREEDPDLAPHI